MKKIKNRIVPFLLAFAIILTMMPVISFQPADAATVYKFQQAAEWAKNKAVGTGGYGSPAKFLKAALNNGGFTNITATTSAAMKTQLTSLVGSANVKTNPTEADIKQYDIIHLDGGSWGIYDGSKVITETGTVIKETRQP